MARNNNFFIDVFTMAICFDKLKLLLTSVRFALQIS